MLHGIKTKARVMKSMLIFGARPNFMKIAPVYRAMRARGDFDPTLVHTGQHFDKEMSSDFLQALELPTPDFHLAVGSGTQAWQMAEVIKRLEPMMAQEPWDVVVVVGDVTSTLGAALAASICEVPVAHVEAGLRSRDWGMPEERNRVLTDRLSRFLLTPSSDADENLRSEGIPDDRVFMVGNVMVDSLDWMLPRMDREGLLKRFEVNAGSFGLVTLHRPSNVDDPRVLKGILQALSEIASELPLLFPVHPRTQQRIEEFGVIMSDLGIKALSPMGYEVFTSLLADARMVMTDSGGIQEEATVLGTPCLTLRENTERPVTVESGINQIVGCDPYAIIEKAREVLSRPRPDGVRPPLWDGNAAERIVEVLAA